jgi:hypothetical protein
MTDFFYALGDFFMWLFENTLEPLGNLPNWSFIVLGFIGMFIWLKMQKDFNAEAKSKGTLK